MNLLTQNTKLKKTSKELGKRVFNFGIPAYKSASGKLTCPMALECIKFCYAKKGAYIWYNVKPAFEKRYELTKTANFEGAMIAEINKKKVDFVRIHDSGDFYSKKYLDKWLYIAAVMQHIKFYAYTNMIEMFKNIILPDNFDVIFSNSGKQKHLIDRITDRHTEIFKSKDELIAAGYANASENDLNATKWFNKTNKVGLIYH